RPADLSYSLSVGSSLATSSYVFCPSNGLTSALLPLPPFLGGSSPINVTSKSASSKASIICSSFLTKNNPSYLLESNSFGALLNALICFSVKSGSSTSNTLSDTVVLVPDPVFSSSNAFLPSLAWFLLITSFKIFAWFREKSITIISSSSYS